MSGIMYCGMLVWIGIGNRAWRELGYGKGIIVGWFNGLALRCLNIKRYNMAACSGWAV